METKEFDTVEFMRKTRGKMDAEMRDLSFEEQRAYIERHAGVRRKLEKRGEPAAA